MGFQLLSAVNLEDVQGVLRRLATALKKGGKALLIEPVLAGL